MLLARVLDVLPPVRRQTPVLLNVCNWVGRQGELSVSKSHAGQKYGQLCSHSLPSQNCPQHVGRACLRDGSAPSGSPCGASPRQPPTLLLRSLAASPMCRPLLMCNQQPQGSAWETSGHAPLIHSHRPPASQPAALKLTACDAACARRRRVLSRWQCLGEGVGLLALGLLGGCG